MNVFETMRKIQKLNNELESILKSVGDYCDNVDYNRADPEESFFHDQLMFLTGCLEEVQNRLDYLNKPVAAQGFLKHNDHKRYTLPTGDYLTSGSVCELLVTDEDGQRWTYTIIDHDGTDYYATALGKNVSINGMMARIRSY